jgi:hypothetical protein
MGGILKARPTELGWASGIAFFRAFGRFAAVRRPDSATNYDSSRLGENGGSSVSISESYLEHPLRERRRDAVGKLEGRHRSGIDGGAQFGGRLIPNVGNQTVEVAWRNPRLDLHGEVIVPNLSFDSSLER